MTDQQGRSRPLFGILHPAAICQGNLTPTCKAMSLLTSPAAVRTQSLAGSPGYSSGEQDGTREISQLEPPGISLRCNVR